MSLTQAQAKIKGGSSDYKKHAIACDFGSIEQAFLLLSLCFGWKMLGRMAERPSIEEHDEDQCVGDADDNSENAVCEKRLHDDYALPLAVVRVGRDPLPKKKRPDVIALRRASVYRPFAHTNTLKS
jgi:hypothetical protein